MNETVPAPSEPPPDIEDVSVESLVSEIADEFMRRVGAGEHPLVAEYTARHPQIARILQQVLPALQALRQAPMPHAPLETGCLGDFRLLAELGRGGMGIVYEALQISLGRRVALKVLPFAATLDPRQLQRFKNEAQAAANLHHAHIVPVFGVGCERGVHYYAMQLIDGKPLSALIGELWQCSPHAPREVGGLNSQDAASVSHDAQRPHAEREDNTTARASTQIRSHLTKEDSLEDKAFFRNVARLGIQAAGALEHAHQQGVVHRDIKPANLLIDVRGNLWITDFGLAHVRSDANLTMTGDLVGTLRYMSPEQALGQRGTIDQRTDLYSLGATLYELLTLEPAFRGRDRQELLQQIAETEPPAPRTLNPALPVDLETIVVKAMAKTPADRYACAQDMADDLQRFLEDKPIHARRPTLGQRLGKWARRNRSVVRAGAGTLLLAVVGLAASTALVWQAKRDAEAAQREIETTNIALKAETKALQLALAREQETAYYQSIALAEVEWLAGENERAERLLDACSRDLRQWEWFCLKRALHTELVRVRVPGLTCMASRADGKVLATGNANGALEIWDATTGNWLRRLQRDAGRVVAMAFRPDGKQLLAATQHKSPDGKLWTQVSAWDTTTGESVFGVHHKGNANSIAYHPLGKQFALAFDERVHVCVSATGAEQLSLRDGGKRVTYSNNGEEIFTGTGASVQTCSATNGQLKYSLLLGSRSGAGAKFLAANVVTSLAVDANGERVWTAGSDKNVIAWDVKTQKPTALLPGAGIRLARSPVDELLATATDDGTIHLWNARTEKSLARFRAHGSPLLSMAFSADGKTLISAGAETVKVWDVADALRGFLPMQDGGILAFGPRGKTQVHARGAGAGSLREAATGKSIAPLAGILGKVAYANDESLFAYAGSRRNVGLINPATGQELPALGNREGIHTLALDAAGRLVAASGKDMTIPVWEAATGKLLHRFPGHGARVSRLAFHPNRQWLASSSDDGSVIVWDLTSGKEARRVADANIRVRSIAFRPDGTQLAAALDDNTVAIIDPATGASLRRLRGHSSAVHEVAYSPDGKRLASAGADKTVKLWNPDTGQAILTLRGHTMAIHSLAFHPDGKRLASVAGGMIGAPVEGRLWDARPLR